MSPAGFTTAAVLHNGNHHMLVRYAAMVGSGVVADGVIDALESLANSPTVTRIAGDTLPEQRDGPGRSERVVDPPAPSHFPVPVTEDVSAVDVYSPDTS